MSGAAKQDHVTLPIQKPPGEEEIIHSKLTTHQYCSAVMIGLFINDQNNLIYWETEYVEKDSEL